MKEVWGASVPAGAKPQRAVVLGGRTFDGKLRTCVVDRFAATRTCADLRSRVAEVETCARISLRKPSRWDRPRRTLNGRRIGGIDLDGADLVSVTALGLRKRHLCEAVHAHHTALLLTPVGAAVRADRGIASGAQLDL